MEFNKIAGAVLLTALAAMIVSKVGDILIPEEHFVVQRAGDQPQTTSPKKPEEKDPPVGRALAQADPEKGEALTKARCGSCHTWNKGGPNRVGPNIYGVVGRDKGGHEGYNYSSAMAEAPGNWGYEQLYAYLEDPQGVVKGTKMAFQLRKWDQRADVIAYLRTQHDNPPPLPEPEPEPAKTDPAQTTPDENEPAEQTQPDQTAPKDTAPESQPDTQSQPEKKSETTPDSPSAPAEKTEPRQTQPEQTEPEQTEPEQTEPDNTEPAPNTDDETQ